MDKHDRAISSHLIQTHSIISLQMDKKRLEIILSQLENVLMRNIPGDIVEFGCHEGTTSLFIRRLLDALMSDKQFYAYDSFEGLPSKTIEDASVAGSDFRAGELKVSKHDLMRNFQKAGLRPPIAHKAWFSELKEKAIPENVAFGFLDSDFYQSIKDSLAIVWPRLSDNGVIIVDDYMRSHLPGATRAVNDFATTNRIQLKHQSNLAILIK